MSTAVSLIATFISAVALVGVATSLLLQSRQLRVSQLQASRALQVELIRIGIDNPALASAAISVEPNDAAKAGFVNLNMKYLESSYLLNAISRSAVSLQAAALFEADYPCEWWRKARATYKAEAATKREREFFSLVDASFRDAIEGRDVGVDSRDVGAGS